MTVSAPRVGAFEAPADPPTASRLRVDPAWSPRRLSGALVRNVWPWVLSGSLLLILYNVAGMLTPLAIGGLVDAVIAPANAGAPLGGLVPALLLWGGVLAGLYLALNLGYRFGGRLGWYGVQRSQFELSQAVLARVLDRRGMAGAPRAPGNLLAVSTGDVHRACLVLYVTVYPPGQAIGLVTAAVVLLGVHPLLGLGVVIALPLVLWLMQLAARPLRRRSLAEQEGLADAAAAAADLVAGYRVLRGLHAHETAAERYRAVSRRALRSTLAARGARAAFEGISTSMAQLFAAAVALVAAALALMGQISAGQLAAVAGVAVMLVGPLDQLAGTLGSYWAISQASAKRVLELLAAGTNPASRGTLRAEDAPPALELRECALPGAGRIDTTVPAGALVVLDVPQPAHGPLADVLAARRLPERGGVAFAGVPVHELDPGHLRSRLLVAPHSPGVFSGTVLDNVRSTGETPADRARALLALEAAGIGESELPEGYETAVGDGGWQLSGGQRQRVALARALAAEPEALVLIEPTTSVDSVTEQRIAARIREFRADRTTIVVTASSAFRAIADRVIAVDSEEQDRA